MGRSEGVSERDEGPDLDRGWLERVRRNLVAWYATAARDLAWRRERDPYRIWIAETMLSQTTVAAVEPYYERFTGRFPTVESLAEAEEAEVLKAWEGLGYYRRARLLQKAARRIVAEHGGEIPSDLAALGALPGVGRYIAGAVMSFAFDRPAPIVEANTRRVLARWLAWPDNVNTSRSQRRFWRAAERLVPTEAPGMFNQAFMELGALVCAPRNPACLTCPVARECSARFSGLQDLLPAVGEKKKVKLVKEACAIVVREGRYLIVQRASGNLWDGFWEFPTIHLEGADPAFRAFSDEEGKKIDFVEGVRRLTGIVARIGPETKTVRYVVTRHKVELIAHLGESDDRRPPIAGPGLSRAIWADLKTCATLPFGTPGRRLLAWLSDLGVDPSPNARRE